jgi:TRAP-type C4-dicarboxylate transport system permease small subunit
MRRFFQWADALVLGLAAIFVAGFLGCVVLQVLFRYVIAAPLPWSEEAARYLFVWTAFLAAAAAVGRDDHFAISFLADNVPPRGRWALQLLGSGLGLLFLVIVTWKGAVMSLRLWSAVSPVIQLPQGSVYAVIPGTGLYMSAHLLARLHTLLREGPRAAESP